MVKGPTKMIKVEDTTTDDDRRYFNLQKVANTTKIQQDKIYNNFKGMYTSLTAEEKKQIATCLMGPVKKMFESLGMSVSFFKNG